jgi:type IV pilus assembly protein PilM
MLSKLALPLSLFSRSPALIGCDISSSAVKLVELSAGAGGGYRVERYAIEALPRDAVVDGNIANIDAVGGALKRAHAALGGSSKALALALPAAAVITKKVILSGNQSEDDMELQVQSEANQYIPFSLDEVNLDFQVLGPAPSGLDEVEVLIAASRKEKIEDRVAAAEAAGLKATVMDVESFAAQAAFELMCTPESGIAEKDVVVIVDIGALITRVTVLHEGQTVYSREQQIGGNQLSLEVSRTYDLSAEAAEAGKRAGTLPPGYATEVLAPFNEKIALEVQRALQFFFTATQFTRVDHIVLTGGCSVLDGLQALVAERTQIRTTVANPFSNMALASRIKPRQLVADAPALMVACGLAMRRFDSA